MGDVDQPGNLTSEQLTAAWATAQDELPPGWRLDSLQCASSGLAPDQRSADWIAVALGPQGEEQMFRAPDALHALSGLAAACARR